MAIRRYETRDLAPVVALFTSSVHTLGAADYDEQQRAAWAPRPPDLDAWRDRLAMLETLVYEDDDKSLAGFIGFEADGHIDLLYTAPGHDRRGVASALYEEAEAAIVASGAETAYTEASAVARPFFERRGFEVVEEETVERRGVAFERFVMTKSLG